MQKHLSNCPICKREKSYKTLQGFNRCKDKPCISCANSIKAGGVGNKFSGGLFSCADCGERKDREDFMSRVDGRPYSYCKSCQSIKNKNAYKGKWRYEKYGIDGDTFLQILNKQGNKCAGCNLELSNPHIDHCHKTEKVRGLLCKECNSTLGFVKENTTTLRNLADYLENNK